MPPRGEHPTLRYLYILHRFSNAFQPVDLLVRSSLSCILLSVLSVVPGAMSEPQADVLPVRQPGSATAAGTKKPETDLLLWACRLLNIVTAGCAVLCAVALGIAIALHARYPEVGGAGGDICLLQGSGLPVTKELSRPGSPPPVVYYSSNSRQSLTHSTLCLLAGFTPSPPTVVQRAGPV